MLASKKYTDYLTNPPEKFFFLRPRAPDEIADIIKKTNIGKSLRHNSIPTNMLRQFPKSISIVLSNLINYSFENDVFPSAIKLVSVIPVFMKGDYLQCKNYRPISLILNKSKKTEKLVHQRLYLFLEQNSISYNSQYGFRNKHSTTLLCSI